MVRLRKKRNDELDVTVPNYVVVIVALGAVCAILAIVLKLYPLILVWLR